ncbi:hypothetical protein GEMRC1_012539 [Eukaryota sp. GEM-RC1]
MWLREIEDSASENVPILLVGNKSDLIEQREVTDEQARAFATERGLQYIPTSAKTAENVECSFHSLAKQIRARFDDQPIKKPIEDNIHQTLASFMNFSISAEETLSALLEEQSITDNTLIFDDQSISVNKDVLAINSIYFKSLWYLDFSDKQENPLDFSHLKVQSSSFISFFKAFYSQLVDISPSNCHDFFYLAHYFQVPKLIDPIESIIKKNFSNWSWFKEFLSQSNRKSDLRAVQFAGPYVSQVSDLVVDDVIELSFDCFLELASHCTDNQSQSWLIKSLVSAILSSSFDLDELHLILSNLSVELLSFNEWNNYLFKPLEEVKEVELQLMEFFYKKMKSFCFDSLSRKVEELTKEVEDLKKENSKLKETAVVEEKSRGSDCLRFSSSLKGSGLSLSRNGKRVGMTSGSGFHNIRGDQPLLDGNVYNFTAEMSGGTSTAIGIIEEGKFKNEGEIYLSGHVCFNHGYTRGCLAGQTQSLSGTFDVTIDLVNYTISIGSISGNLPRPSSGNYYLVGMSCTHGQFIEIKSP